MKINFSMLLFCMDLVFYIMTNLRESQKFKKGSLYTRGDIYNLYFGELLSFKGIGNLTSGYVQPANSKDLIVL